MDFIVYLLISKIKNRYISYVGYTNNIKNRLELHNSGKGAKFTRGNKWVIIYKKKYKSKSEAMSAEISLKNDKKKRKAIKQRYINKL